MIHEIISIKHVSESIFKIQDKIIHVFGYLENITKKTSKENNSKDCIK